MPYHADLEQRRKERNHRIAELLRAGHSHAQVGQALGMSGPAVTQHIRRWPELRRLTRTHAQESRLRALRHELAVVSEELRAMQREARRAIRELDEELESQATDRLLGLR